MGAGLVVLYVTAVSITALALRVARGSVENDVFSLFARRLGEPRDGPSSLEPTLESISRRFPAYRPRRGLAVAATSADPPGQLTGFFVLSFIYLGS